MDALIPINNAQNIMLSCLNKKCLQITDISKQVLAHCYCSGVVCALGFSFLNHLVITLEYNTTDSKFSLVTYLLNIEDSFTIRASQTTNISHYCSLSTNSLAVCPNQPYVALYHYSTIHLWMISPHQPSILIGEITPPHFHYFVRIHEPQLEFLDFNRVLMKSNETIMIWEVDCSNMNQNNKVETKDDNLRQMLDAMNDCVGDATKPSHFTQLGRDIAQHPSGGLDAHRVLFIGDYESKEEEEKYHSHRKMPQKPQQFQRRSRFGDPFLLAFLLPNKKERELLFVSTTVHCYCCHISQDHCPVFMHFKWRHRVVSVVIQPQPPFTSSSSYLLFGFTSEADIEVWSVKEQQNTQELASFEAHFVSRIPLRLRARLGGFITKNHILSITDDYLWLASGDEILSFPVVLLLPFGTAPSSSRMTRDNFEGYFNETSDSELAALLLKQEHLIVTLDVDSDVPSIPWSSSCLSECFRTLLDVSPCRFHYRPTQLALSTLNLRPQVPPPTFGRVSLYSHLPVQVYSLVLSELVRLDKIEVGSIFRLLRVQLCDDQFGVLLLADFLHRIHACLTQQLIEDEDDVQEDEEDSDDEEDEIKWQIPGQLKALDGWILDKFSQLNPHHVAMFSSSSSSLSVHGEEESIEFINTLARIVASSPTRQRLMSRILNRFFRVTDQTPTSTIQPSVIEPPADTTEEQTGGYLNEVMTCITNILQNHKVLSSHQIEKLVHLLLRTALASNQELLICPLISQFGLFLVQRSSTQELKNQQLRTFLTILLKLQTSNSEVVARRPAESEDRLVLLNGLLAHTLTQYKAEFGPMVLLRLLPDNALDLDASHVLW